MSNVGVCSGMSVRVRSGLFQFILHAYDDYGKMSSQAKDFFNHVRPNLKFLEKSILYYKQRKGLKKKRFLI